MYGCTWDNNGNLSPFSISVNKAINFSCIGEFLTSGSMNSSLSILWKDLSLSMNWMKNQKVLENQLNSDSIKWEFFTLS